MELDTIAKHNAAFYRLVGTTSADDALVENSEAAGDVAYLYLTRGYRACQRWLIDHGMSDRWRSTSAALTWTPVTEGTQYTALPTRFLRLDGDRRRSALVETNGDPWGCEVDTRQDRSEGNYYFLQNERLYLTRSAQPPSTLYLRYFASHAALSAATGSSDFDMPMEARPLAVALAARAAAVESWLPGGPEMVAKIDLAVRLGKEEAKEVARRTRAPREFQRAPRYGNHW